MNIPIPVSSHAIRRAVLFCICAFVICGCSGSSSSTANAIAPDNDSASQTNVLVSFNIRVPSYQSNELRLELVWGDTNITAMWVGDEYWSASGEFPAGIEQLLTVSFYDRNGDIALAEYSELFNAGNNDAASLEITANQFDASQFDEDGDGATNFDESVMGTDPELNGDSLLEVRDSYSLSDRSRLLIDTVLEGRLSDDRPIFEYLERLPEPDGYPGSLYRTVNIDANGNGALTDNEYLLGTIDELSATRTNSGTAITWEGSRYNYDGDYQHRISFTNTVTVINETTRQLREETIGSHVGTYQSRWNFSFDLTGRLIEDSAQCEPVSGTASIYYWGNSSGSATSSETTISKDINEPYWRVVTVWSESETSEYFVRELRSFREFTCDYVDI